MRHLIFIVVLLATLAATLTIPSWLFGDETGSIITFSILGSWLAVATEMALRPWLNEDFE